MRKFKFMSKAVVGMIAVAMTMGSLSGVAFRQPTAVYATDDVEVPTEFNYGTTIPGFTKDTEITALEPVLPAGYKLATSPNVTGDLPAGLVFDSANSDGKVANITGTPTAIIVPTEYTITLKVVPTTDNDDTNAITLTAKVVLSVNADENVIELTAPTNMPTSLEKNKVMTAVEIPEAATDTASTIKSYTSENFPAGIKVEAVTEGGTTKYQIAGTPTTVGPASKGYIVALDNNNNPVAWIAVNFPAVTGSDSTEYSMEASLDMECMTLIVQTTDPYFTVDILKSASDTEKPSKQYVYTNDDGCVEIDLGFLKVKKANYINVYGSSVTDKAKDGTLITIEGQPTKEKFTVDAAKTSFAEAIGKSAADAAKYEIRSSLGSNWMGLDSLDFNAAKVAGTTVVLRQSADATESGSTIKYTPAGPEIKIKIPAAPKAPKITVDYAKGTVKVTEKMQIAWLKGDDPIPEEKSTTAGDGKWVTAKKGMTRKEIAKALTGDENYTDKFTMVVRTEASGKKSASMPVIVTIKEQPVLNFEAGKKDSVAVKIGETTSTLKAVRDKDGGLTFTTSGTFEYEDGGKWKKITSAKLIKNFSSDKVKVRLAGVKADKTPNSGSFESTEVELEVPKPVEAKIDSITIADSAEDGYTKPTLTTDGSTPTSEDKVFKFVPTAKKGSEAVTGLQYTWKVTGPENVTIDPAKWVWDNAAGSLTIKSGTVLTKGDYNITATSEGVTSTPFKITINEATQE